MRYKKNQITMKHLLLIVFITVVQLSFAKINIPETPFTTYEFEAKECRVIQHNKSRIFVQPYTFYLDGKVYDGLVNLKYREFTDQLDIILNHIPMDYVENGKRHILESGGMFELMAYGNGKLLSFAPHKKVQVQLASKFEVNGGETFVHRLVKWLLPIKRQPMSDKICGATMFGQIRKRILQMTMVSPVRFRWQKERLRTKKFESNLLKRLMQIKCSYIIAIEF